MSTEVDLLKETNQFSKVEFVPIGANPIQRLYHQTKNAISKEFVFDRKNADGTISIFWTKQIQLSSAWASGKRDTVAFLGIQRRLEKIGHEYEGFGKGGLTDHLAIIRLLHGSSIVARASTMEIVNEAFG